MAVDGENIVAMVEHHFAAVACAHGRAGNIAVAGGAHGCAVGRVNIEAGVESAFAVDRILALAKAGSDGPLNRPHRWRVRQNSPVALEAGSESTLKGAGDAAGEGIRPQSIELIDGVRNLLLIYVVRLGQAYGRRRR